MVVNAFASGHLDYCNCFSSLTMSDLYILQYIQSSKAGLVGLIELIHMSEIFTAILLNKDQGFKQSVLDPRCLKYLIPT